MTSDRSRCHPTKYHQFASSSRINQTAKQGALSPEHQRPHRTAQHPSPASKSGSSQFALGCDVIVAYPSSTPFLASQTHKTDKLKRLGCLQDPFRALSCPLLSCRPSLVEIVHNKVGREKQLIATPSMDQTFCFLLLPDYFASYSGSTFVANEALNP